MDSYNDNMIKHLGNYDAEIYWLLINTILRSVCTEEEWMTSLTLLTDCIVVWFITYNWGMFRLLLKMPLFLARQVKKSRPADDLNGE